MSNQQVVYYTERGDELVFNIEYLNVCLTPQLDTSNEVMGRLLADLTERKLLTLEDALAIAGKGGKYEDIRFYED